MKRTELPAIERRAAPRLEPAPPIWGQLLLELDSSVRALSTGGMMVRVATPPSIGTTLRLKGVVRNVTTVLQPGPPRYDVGVEFEELDADAREFLERFVASRA
jgi:hypothetical protein